MLAPLLNLVFIPPSSQGVGAVEVPLEVTLEALAEAPPPVLIINWERIKTFRKNL